MAQVYALYFLPSDRAYIGCTRGGVAKRLREHRCLLKSGRHTCPPLQEAWHVYGERELEIRVLRECPDDLESRRTAELEAMTSWVGGLYNEEHNSFRPAEAARRKGVENSRKSVGNRWTPETNEKRRRAQLGKPKGHGAKISATKRAKRLQQVMR